MPSTAKLREWLERFAVAREGGGLSPKTIAWYVDRTNWYFRWLDEHPGRDPLDVESVEIYLTEVRQRLSLGTLSANYRCLNVFFGWCVTRKLLPEDVNPMAMVERPKIPQKRVKYVAMGEFERLLSSITGDSWGANRDRAILIIMFYSGLRVGEVTGLRLCDIDFAGSVIYIRQGKGGEDRTVPAAADLLFAPLECYLAQRPDYAGDALFISNDGYGHARGPLTSEGIRQMLRRRCKENGLRYLNPHAFRHGYAMAFLNAGMQLSAVAATMGHKDTAITTKFYAKWLMQGVQREYRAARKRLAKGGQR